MKAVGELHGNVLNLQIHCNSKTALAWRYNSNSPKTLFTKIKFPKPLNQSCLSSLQSLHHPPPNAIPDENSTKHTTLVVESYHEHQRLKALFERLNKKDSCPLQMLRDDGDWTKDHFWAVIRFLKHESRSNEIIQVFDLWKNFEKSRINDFNYKKIIGLLSEEGLMDEAVSALKEMKSFGLTPSLEIFNFIIHGCARKGKFDDALFFLNDMKEMNLAPETSTYDGLIQAYGKFKMYDEMGLCVKKMKWDGCSPDHLTYNLLIREYSCAGLLKRMESVDQIVLSKRMILHSSTLIAMLEAYASYGILEKMEKVYRMLLKRKTPLKDDLVRKLAAVYIENYMFSRLDDLGVDLASITGRTDLVWCLRLLSHACLLSRRGMDSVVQELDEAKVSRNATMQNIILLAYLKIKDFKHMRILLSELPTRNVKPDIVTVGILFDANRNGFDGTGALHTWRRMGLLDRYVEMNTDPLVLTAFGKGHFLRDCEEVYSSLEPEAREMKRWTYHNLIDLVIKHSGRQPQEKGR